LHVRSDGYFPSLRGVTPPELVNEPDSVPPSGPQWSDREAAALRTQLLHRHLLARLAVARDDLRAVEDRSTAPVVMVERFAAVVTDTQRDLAAERAEAELRSAALLRVADAAAAEVLARARARADALLLVAARLRSEAQEAGPATPAAEPRHDAPMGVRML